MIRPGRIWYLVRRNSNWGVRACFHYYITRSKVLRTAPVERTHDPTCEIHLLTSEEDWLNAMWTLKTFYHFSQRSYRLVIHDDGSLTESSLARLRQHFPAARIVIKHDADIAIEHKLVRHPLCQDLRRRKFISAKEFDFPAFATTSRLLFLDSDVVFLSSPSELLRRIEDPGYRLNSVNPDIRTSYSNSALNLSKQIGCHVPERFNSGVGLIFRDSLNWDWIEEFLALPGVLDHPWRFEQTLAVLCSARWGVELLPEIYAVHLGKLNPSAPLRHYVGQIRHRMYAEGMREAARRGFVACK